MKFALERITPERAREYLEHNVDNYRKLYKDRVDTYAADMRAGLWKENGEAIKFNTKGNLIDGQHRLNAVIKAGVAVPMLVVREIEDDVHIMDVGYSRTLTSIGQNEGIQTNNSMVAASVFIIGNGDSHKRHGSVAVIEYLRNHQDLLRAVYHGSCSRGDNLCKKAPILVAAYCMARDGRDLNDIANFCGIVNTGLPFGHYDPTPALVFRNTLGDYKRSDDATRRALFCVACAAMEDFFNNRSRAKKYYRPDYDYLNLLHRVRLEDGLTA